MERLAQNRKARLRGMHHVAVAAGEDDGDLRIVVGDFVCQGDAVHCTGHHDVAENEIDLVAAPQPVQRVGGVVRPQRLITELFDERRGDFGHLRVVLDHENRALPRLNRLGRRRCHGLNRHRLPAR